MLEAWPVLHRAAGEDGLGSVAAGAIAFMCGFRGFVVPARLTGGSVSSASLFPQFCQFPGEKIPDISNMECMFDLFHRVDMAVVLLQGFA